MRCRTYSNSSKLKTPFRYEIRFCKAREGSIAMAMKCEGSLRYNSSY
jgi:hypothetical protein